MQERYSEEVKSILEAAQQQAVMNYQQELSCAHILVALSSSEGFFRFLLANVKADERNFAQEAKGVDAAHSFCKGTGSSAGDEHSFSQSIRAGSAGRRSR